MKKDLSIFYEALKEYQFILKSKQRRETIIVELTASKRTLAVLEKNIIKEYNDIVELEKKPLTFIFSKVLKNEIEQLEKERQEYLMAVLEHKECLNLIELFEYELNILNKNIQKNEGAEIKFEHVISKIKLDQKNSEHNQISKVYQNTLDIQRHQNLKLEINDVIKIIDQIINAFHKMIESISKAKEYDNWGSFYKEIQKGKAIKKGYLDDAQANLYLIKKLLLYLREELKDIKDIQDDYSELDLYNFNVNYHTNLISDWLQDSNLSATLISTLLTHLNLTKLKRELDQILLRTNQNIENLEESRLALIENFQ